MDWPRALVIIERFERMAKINLRELQLLHRSIVDNSTRKDSVSAVSSKRDASQKIDQLLGGLQQILHLRNQLSIANQERFDDRIEPIRIQIQAVVNALNTIISTVSETQEQKNIYDDLYEKSLLPQESKDSEEQQEQRQMRINSLRLRAEEAKRDAEETRKLASDIEDISDMMVQLAQLVHSQHEVVDSIEEHIEKAQLDVHSAHKNLKKAQAAQTAKYPMVAAAVGGVAVGGPVGFAAGSAVAGVIAALGGAAAGLYSGRYFRRKVQQTANRGSES